MAPSCLSLPSTQPLTPDIFICRKPAPNRQLFKTGALADSKEERGILRLCCVSAENHATPVTVLARDRLPLAMPGDHC